ncbi:hypothetical protein D9M71_764820 [compost metagenome]
MLFDLREIELALLYVEAPETPALHQNAKMLPARLFFSRHAWKHNEAKILS